MGLLVVSGLMLACCGSGAVTTRDSGGPSPAGSSSAQPSPSPAAQSSEQAETTQSPEPKHSPVVVLDPGHNGGNGAATEQINQHVPAGRGRTKPCNTTGTATDDGYPEHAFTFDVAQRVRRSLTANGIEVVLTRDDDSGVGPCVDRRAAIGNQHEAAAVVSIHADGRANADATGFHIAYSSPPLNDAQGEPTLRLASAMRAGMRDAGFPIARYIGSDGLSPRDDLAGMNLSERPAVLVECGNMRNADEAAVMRTATGRQSYADAIVDGITRYLGRP